MPVTIQVEKQADGAYRVRVREGDSESSHRVTLAADYHRKLTAGRMAPEELVRRSFEFLLEREPKESILEKFDLAVIGRYFPEYEGELKKRLSGSPG